MSELSHGNVGKREQAFTSLLPLRACSYDAHLLATLAEKMKGPVDTVKDGPDPEENILVPAGYTYFGQFIDHDLTFDSTSSLDTSSSASPSNLRTPRFDLDCLYGDGPDAQPFMYDGARLLYKNDHMLPGKTDASGKDLLRNPLGRAIIGDKRNDENSIVSQIQLSFVKYHNAVVEALSRMTDHSKWNTPNKLFESARNEVRWSYQKLITEDFLPRIIAKEVLENLNNKAPSVRAKNYALYTEDKRGNLPREFVAAAYRFGHSGVRTGYRLNDGLGNRFSIFPSSEDNTVNPGAESLLGFDPITNNQLIDNWERFFPTTLPLAPIKETRDEPADEDERTEVRLQFAYKIDPTLVDPLGALPIQQVAGEDTTAEASRMIAPMFLPPTGTPPTRPSLALLNLLRGDSYRIQSGQALAKALHDKGLHTKPLDAKYLVTRQPVKGKEGIFKFEPIPSQLHDETPLWFYVLAEAQAPIIDHFGHKEFDEKELLNGVGAKAQLGWVGGRIVAEVFYGLLDSDPDAYINAAPADWMPMLGGDQTVIFRNLLKFADSSNA